MIEQITGQKPDNDVDLNSTIHGEALGKMLKRYCFDELAAAARKHKLLGLGAGLGNPELGLAQELRIPEEQVTLLDKNPKLKFSPIFVREHPEVTYTTSDIQEFVSHSVNQYSLVTLIGVEYIFDKKVESESLIRALPRVTTPNGLVIVSPYSEEERDKTVWEEAGFKRIFMTLGDFPTVVYQRKPKVLKLSESALSVSGQYLAEVGNMSYRDKSDMFVYDPESGLLISGYRKSDVALLSPYDVIKLHEDYGYITIRELFGDQKGIFSGNDFQRFFYEYYQTVRDRIDIIEQFAQVQKVGWNFDVVDRCIKNISINLRAHTPKELYAAMLDYIQAEIKQRGVDIHDKRVAFERTNILSHDIKVQAAGITDFAMLIFRLGEIDCTDPVIMYEQGFALLGSKQLTLLMEKFRKDPNANFSDSLLVACSLLEKQWLSEK